MNIVEVVQSSLVKNFSILSRKMAHHDALFHLHSQNMLEQQTQNASALHTLQEQVQQHQQLVT